MKDEERIKYRLYSLLQTSSLHLMEFLKLVDVRFTDEVDTAATTCGTSPELLLNRDFIDTYCQTDEHLFMLVMHELYHVILGHTKLFPTATEIDNIAFDAIINALLCRMFPGEEYVSFFTSTNSDDSFPGALLRPIGPRTPRRLIPLLDTLYNSDKGTYYEVYQAIVYMAESGLFEMDGNYRLFGNHSENSSINNPVIKEMIERIVAKWPRMKEITGRDLGGELTERKVSLQSIDPENYRRMTRLLRKSGVLPGDDERTKPSLSLTETEAVAAMPNFRDRTVVARSAIYGTPLLYQQKMFTYIPAYEQRVKTLVYLDVSGSVVNDLGRFMPLLLQPYREHRVALFAFSTEVCPVTYRQFRNGEYKSTGGTSIDCVFDHLFSLKKPGSIRKVLVLTDGYTGSVSDRYRELLKKYSIEVYVGLFGSYEKVYLQGIARVMEVFK